MIEIVDMNRFHIDGVLEVENSTFHIPWTRADFEKEIKENNMAVYKVALDDGKPVGYAGMWHIVNEGHMWGSVLKILADKAAEGVDVRLIYDGMCEVICPSLSLQAVSGS